MGCDGGTIPRRDEMVKLKKKAQKADKDVELAARWRHCAVSAEELRQPIVACELGRLYNKESVLMALLDKTNMPEIIKHIRSMKDVVQLRLTPNPSYKLIMKGDSYNDVQSAQYVCPVSGLEMSGIYRFAFLRSCGCVFAEKALKEVRSENCHLCGKPFSPENVVIINGSDDDMERQRSAMEERRKAVRLAKRKRKDASGKEPEASSSSDKSQSSPPLSESSTSTHTTPSPDDAPPKEKKSRMDDGGSKASEPSSSSKAKVSKSSGGRTVFAPSGDGKSSSSAGASVSSSSRKADSDFESRQAYRSLFNSSAPARPKEQTSHWVTFFPYH